MTATGHYEPEDLALFAMQLVAGPVCAGVREHLKDCEECRQELDRIQGDLSAVALTVEMQSPGAEARDRLMKQVAREKRTVPIDSASAPAAPAAAPVAAPLSTFGRGLGSGDYLDEEELLRRRKRHTILPWLGWVAAAALAFAAGSLYQQRDALQKIVATQSSTMNQTVPDVVTARALMATLTNPAAKRVVLNMTPEAKPKPQGRATYVAANGALVFAANNLEPLPAEKTYELWLIPANGQAPIPAGTFRPDTHGDASVILPPLPKGVEAKAFGVTVEAAGGATKPTLPIILVGE